MKKILMINDDTVVAALYRNKLEAEGFQVAVVSDGEAAIATLKQDRPDVLLLDLMLPKVDGLGVLRFLRSQLETYFTPVVAFANTYLRREMEEAIAAGANRCLAKSDCTSKQVVELVRELLVPPPSALAGPPPVLRAPFLPENTPSAEQAAGLDVDLEFQQEMQRHFRRRAPEMLRALRENLEGLARADSPPAREARLADFYAATRLLCGHAGLAGFSQVSELASGLEALAKAVQDSPEYFTASTLRTLAQASELLRRRLEQVQLLAATPSPPSMILMVDDSKVDLMLLGDALEKVNLKGLGVGEPEMALRLAESNTFDLIFMDVEMPGMNGFDLCAKLRTLASHRNTPVVFVTVHSDVNSIARSASSGGNDFIAKPFLDVELGVKALIHIHRVRSQVTAADLEQAVSYLHAGRNN